VTDDTNNRYTTVNIEFTAKNSEIQTQDLVLIKFKNSRGGGGGVVANLFKGGPVSIVVTGPGNPLQAADSR
jgi:lipopolysaccharide export system protein LptC